MTNKDRKGGGVIDPSVRVLSNNGDGGKKKICKKKLTTDDE